MYKTLAGNKAYKGWQFAGVTAGIVGFVFSGLASAQSSPTVHPSLQDRWNFQLGAYWPTAETTAHLDSLTTGRGTTIDFEDELGLSDRKTVGSFLASLRLGERWRIEAEYFALDRSGTRQLNRTINWGDQVFPVTATVNSSFNSDIYRLSVGYSFIKDNTSELGVVLGLYATDFTLSIGAPNLGTQKGDALAPLPTIGVYGAYAFSPKWLIAGRFDYFSLNYGDYDGSLTSLNASVEYRVTRHFGLGAGYRYIDYDIDVTKTSFTGGVQYKFHGPTLFATASF